MREIKFRAWDGERMKDVLTIGLNEGYLMTPKGSGPLEDYNLMQYIGLNDKNGKEIYEGDIVCWNTDEFVDSEGGFNRTEPEGQMGTVKYGSHEFYVDGEKGSEFYSYGEQNFLWSELEIIGNIYENPELIEK